MLAPNMTLELGLREPVQASGSSQRLEQKSSEPSSFERALERARTEQNSSGEQKVDSSQAQTEQADAPQEQSAKHTGETSGKEAVGSAEGSSVKEALGTETVAKAEGRLKGINLAVVAEETAGEPQALAMKGAVAEGLDPESLSKELVLEKSAVDKEGPELSADAPAGGALVLAESLEEAAKAQQVQQEDPERKTKRIGVRDVDYSVAQILQNSQQGEKAAGKVSLAAGAVAEMQGEIKALKLETGTALDDKIQVQDLRTAAENGVTEASLKDGNFVTTVSQGEGSVDMSLQLAGNQTGGKTSSVAGGGKEASFSSMLSSQLQNNAAEIVRNGSIILRDGNAGTINLVLHPEELGNVRISLELNDRMVSAQIRVASEEAFQAFKESIASLKQAFADSGFDTGAFDLSWGGNGQQQGGQQSQNQQTVAFAETLYGEMLAEDGLDSGAEGETPQKRYSDSPQVAVNIMA